jgi:hypothetical protein
MSVNENRIIRNFPKIITLVEPTASLDRIDSSKGYIEGNLQWVHKNINMLKGNMLDNTFIEWCHKISKHQLEKYMFV